MKQNKCSVMRCLVSKLGKVSASISIAAVVALLLIWPTTQAFAADVDLLSPGTIHIDGEAPTDVVGSSMSAAGDVNDDGIDDVIVGAPGADFNDRSDSGSAYVIYGTPQRNSIDLVGEAGTRGFRIDGSLPGDAVGSSVAAAGDVNGDGIDDVIVGAPLATAFPEDSGAAYVIYGQSTDDPPDVDLQDLVVTEGFVIESDVPSGQLGGSVSGAGFFNDDAIADVVVGAPNINNSGIETFNGTSYVIYGEASPTGDVNVDNLGFLGGQESRGMIIAGEQLGGLMGGSVAGIGDFAGDARSDVAIGAQGFDVVGDEGRVYVIYGENTPDPTDVDTSLLGTGFAHDARGVPITGDVTGDGLGVAGGRRRRLQQRRPTGPDRRRGFSGFRRHRRRGRISDLRGNRPRRRPGPRPDARCPGKRLDADRRGRRTR